MTFLGFIVAVLIIGGIFYAWYAYAGRTRENDDAQGRNETAFGAGRMRTSTAMETGTIGELPEGEQDKYVEGTAVNSGNIPRNVLNPDHGYNVETGTIGDVDDEPQGLSAYPDEANALANVGDFKNATESSLNLLPQTQGNEQGEQSGTAGMDTATAANSLNAGAQTMGNNIHTTGDTAGSATGQTSVADNTKNAAKDLTSAIHQAFREEFYHMDDNDKTH
jgi:hypothetical protein